MLQIDHIYEFLYENIFKDFDFYHCRGGVVNTDQVSYKDIHLFTQGPITTKKIFFYDQEPFIHPISDRYMDLFNWQARYSVEENIAMAEADTMPYGHLTNSEIEILSQDPNRILKTAVLVTSERSPDVHRFTGDNFRQLYYFFHGFAALDWYRGHYALNYNKPSEVSHKHDFISYNRIINHDRSYRIYFVSKLVEQELLEHGSVSFNVTDNLFDDWRDEVADPHTKLSDRAKLHAEKHLVDVHKLVIDSAELPGSASADIPRGNDAFWHIVTETVFYYDKLHLTEKIFKPIVNKQPFMLLAAPGNLAYLRSYGFKTFDGIIDESYDLIEDNDLRVDAVVNQLHWYCNLTPDEKIDIIRQLAPIIDYNFHHFYGEFRHIITKELLDNTKTLFQSIGYNDSHTNYDSIYRMLTQ